VARASRKEATRPGRPGLFPITHSRFVVPSPAGRGMVPRPPQQDRGRNYQATCAACALAITTPSTADGLASGRRSTSKPSSVARMISASWCASRLVGQRGGENFFVSLVEGVAGCAELIHVTAPLLANREA
jgi:hypothetical protein